MEIRHLRYFVAVAEALSFRRAAERLSMAQPPLSQQIRDLEEELGVMLFDRTHRHVQLTSAGRVFLADSYQILAQLEHATRRARRAGEGELGQLTIGYTSLVSYPFFPEILRRHQMRYPGVALLLRDLVTIEQMQQLQTNTLDVSFATYASLVLQTTDQERITYENILREPLVAVLPTSHRLATHASLPLIALADESWIWFARQFDSTTYDYMMRLFEQLGFRPKITQEIHQLQILLGAVAAGLGISILPVSATRPDSPDIVYLALTDPTPQVEFDIVWRRGDNSTVLQAFLQIVREVAREGTFS